MAIIIEATVPAEDRLAAKLRGPFAANATDDATSVISISIAIAIAISIVIVRFRQAATWHQDRQVAF